MMKIALFACVMLACLDTCGSSVLNGALWNKQFESNYPETECVDSCDDIPDGDYQSCEGCQVFVTCSNGRIEENRACTVKKGGLVWDDFTKKCEWFSSTCPLKLEEDEEDTRCVRDCTELPDGEFPSCTGCGNFVTCSNGQMYADRECPSVLVWDNTKKRCEWETTTCVDLKSAYLASTSRHVPRVARHQIEAVSRIKYHNLLTG